MSNSQKNTDDREIQDCIIGEKCGTITVSMYKERNSGSPIFYVRTDNENVLPVSYVIEDILALY